MHRGLRPRRRWGRDPGVARREGGASSFVLIGWLNDWRRLWFVAFSPLFSFPSLTTIKRRQHQGNPPLRFVPQLEAPDLGARMRAALNEGLGGSSSTSVVARGGAAAALVVGSDIPDLQPHDVRAAVDALAVEGVLAASTSAKATDPGGKCRDYCVLGPAVDGGFWVVGVRRRRSRGSDGGSGSGESDGSHSSLLLPDALFEVLHLFFLFFFLVPAVCARRGENLSLSFSLSLTHESKENLLFIFRASPGRRPGSLPRRRLRSNPAGWN